MMKDLKKVYRTTDIRNGTVRKIGEHNFPSHELVMKNRNGCSSLGCKNLNLIQTQG